MPRQPYDERVFKRESKHSKNKEGSWSCLSDNTIKSIVQKTIMSKKILLKSAIVSLTLINIFKIMNLENYTDP